MELTIADIAREAEVSRATVSRVLNNKGKVKASTVAKIHAVMKKIGYERPAIRPGPKPQANATQIKENTIALIAVGGTEALFQEPALAMIVVELQNACRRKNLHLLLDQMTAADQVPLCAQTKQAGGAIVLITGHPPYGEEAIAALASHLPCVHLFSPNHPVPAIDHVTINDVAIGHLAFKTLQEAGCQSYAVITTSEVLHQALLVRGRAFLVRAFEQKEQALCFAKPMDAGDPSRVWPQPLTVFEDFSEIIDKIANLPRPVGIFLTLEVHAAQLHALLKEANLLKNSAVQLIIAGTTPQYVQTLDPAPILIDLRFPELINAAIHQLMHRSQQTGAQHLTLQLPPSIKSIQPS